MQPNVFIDHRCAVWAKDKLLISQPARGKKRWTGQYMCQPPYTEVPGRKPLWWKEIHSVCQLSYRENKLFVPNIALYIYMSNHLLLTVPCKMCIFPPLYNALYIFSFTLFCPQYNVPCTYSTPHPHLITLSSSTSLGSLSFISVPAELWGSTSFSSAVIYLKLFSASDW